MTIINKIAIALSITTVSVLSIASNASAETAETQESGLPNAAAAVLMEVDESGNILNLSAAASFGATGAAALALPSYAGAVGSSVPNGIISADGFEAVGDSPEFEDIGQVKYFVSESPVQLSINEDW